MQMDANACDANSSIGTMHFVIVHLAKKLVVSLQLSDPTLLVKQTS